MNAAGVPPRGAAGATASCISDHLPRITTSAINDNGAETKKNPRLPYGIIIKPPKNGSDKYSIKEIQLLGSKFTKNDLVPAIVKSDFGPLQRTLYRNLEGVKVVYQSLSPEEQSEVDTLILLDPKRTKSISDADELAARSSSTSSTSTNISCAYVKETSTSVTASQSQAAPLNDTDDMTQLEEGTAVSDAAVPDKPRTVTPENVPPITSNSPTSTSCVVEESTPTPSSLAPTVSGSRYNSTSARSATSSFSTIGSAKTSQQQSATGNKQPTDTYPSRSRSISPTPMDCSIPPMGGSIMQCIPVAARTISRPTGCNSPAPQQSGTNILLHDTNISSSSITPAISAAQRSTATSSTVAGRQHIINSSRTARKRPVEALEENPTRAESKRMLYGCCIMSWRRMAPV